MRPDGDGAHRNQRRRPHRRAVLPDRSGKPSPGAVHQHQQAGQHEGQDDHRQQAMRPAAAEAE